MICLALAYLSRWRQAFEQNLDFLEPSKDLPQTIQLVTFLLLPCKIAVGLISPLQWGQ
ncbi:hypothetical protein [Helicobacter jaachi]|uniref:hypothetical protein n=1 Tax=Helicobacter jaachi TaxID=1677920 RepID=UPI000A76353F|nr:hypothetical protein [Helicobacter jaachi]